MFASSTIPGDSGGGGSLLRVKVIYGDRCFHKSRPRVDGFCSLGSIRGWTQYCNGRKVGFLWLWVYLEFCEGCFQNFLEGLTSCTWHFNNPVLKTQSVGQQNVRVCLNLGFPVPGSVSLLCRQCKWTLGTLHPFLELQFPHLSAGDNDPSSHASSIARDGPKNVRDAVCQVGCICEGYYSK